MILEINTDNLIYNLDHFRNKFSPGTRIMVMVKAFGYGLGNPGLSSLLEKVNIDYLGVAYVNEGVSLRRNGISTPIMVMNPRPDQYEEIVSSDLEPEIFNLRGLKILDAFTRQKDTKVSLHLKLETGMNRLGFERKDLPVLLEIIKANKNLEVKGILSHLSSAEMEEEEKFTLGQIEEFKSFSGEIANSLGIQPIRHLLNTAGAINFTDYEFEMVRLGIGIYGIDRAFNERHNPLKVTATLKAVISQIKTLNKGDSVGYSRSGKVDRDGTRIATVAIGYADGFYRSLGNGNGKVWLNGYYAPTFGNICMDMFMIDVTGIPVEEGDTVEIFGENLAIETVAEAANTIPYEVFTSIGERVQRVYT